MRFPAKKRWHSLPPSGCLGTPLPLPQSVRTDGRTDVRTDGHVTITSQPKFLGLIGYHISLAMELRWRALPAGSAKNRFVNGKGTSSLTSGPEYSTAIYYLKMLTEESMSPISPLCL